MAEEVVGSLAVELALRSGSFESGMRRASSELKAIDLGFKASAAEAAAAGEKFDTLGQRQASLAEKLSAAEQMNAAYVKQLERMREKATKLAASEQELATKVQGSKAAFEAAKASLDEHRKAGDMTADELKKLAQEVKSLNTTYKSQLQQQKTVTQSMAAMQGNISKTEAAYNEMRLQSAKTRAELNSTEAALKKQTTAWGKLVTAAEKGQQGFEKAGKGLSSFGNKATVALTAPIAAGFYKAGQAAMDYEGKMASIATLADTKVKSLNTLSNELLQISDDTNTAIGSLADAEYQALSSNITTAEASAYMAVSAKAAKAGFADLTTAVDGNTTVLSAWGLSAAHATDVYDKMIIAQDVGKTTLGEIAGSIGQVAATAAGLEISYTEIMAASAALTQGGIATSQSYAMLNQVLANVLKPTAQATSMAKKLGLEFDATAIKTKGLAGFLADVEAKAGGNESAIARLFGSVEAYKAVAALAGAQSENFAGALDALNNSAGAVEKNFATVSDTSANRMSAALNRLNNQAIQFGDAMLPGVDTISNKIDGLIDGLNGMDAAARSNLLLGAGAVAAIGPASKAIGALATGISRVDKLISSIDKSGGLAAAVGLKGFGLQATMAALGIGAVVAAVKFANAETDAINERFSNLELGLDEKSKAEFDAKVAEYTENSEQIMAIKLKVDTEKVDLENDLASALADGKLTRGEANKLRKSIGEWVDDAIAGIEADMETKAAGLATALDGLSLSDEAKADITSQAETKGAEMVSTLQGYQDELDALLKSASGVASGMTEAQLARYQELLDIIATIKQEASIANAGLADYYEAENEYLSKGKGTPTQVQANIQLGFEVAEDDYEAAIAKIDEKINAMLEHKNEKGLAKETRDEIQAEIEIQIANKGKLEEDYAAKIREVLNNGAAAAVAGLDDGENRLSTLLDNYMKLGMLSDKGANFNKLGTDTEYKKQYIDMINGILGTTYAEDNSVFDPRKGTYMLNEVTDKAMNALKAGMLAEMETGDWNPIMEMFNNSLENVDMEKLDKSKLSEIVKGLFGMGDMEDGAPDLDLMSLLFGNLGLDTTGAEGAASPISEKAAELAGKTVVEPFRTAIATAMPTVGSDAMAAVSDGITAGETEVTTAGEGAISRALDAMQLKASAGVKIPVSVSFASPDTKKYSRQLGIFG